MKEFFIGALVAFGFFMVMVAGAFCDASMFGYAFASAGLMAISFIGAYAIYRTIPEKGLSFYEED